MSGLASADSPRYGYEFDGYEMNVLRSRKDRTCVGGRRSRASAKPGPKVPECSDIRAGDIYVAVLDNSLFHETSTCIPCALACGAVTATKETDDG